MNGENTERDYTVLYYFMRTLSSGLDGAEKYATAVEALKDAKKRVKAASGCGAHAVVSILGAHIASVAKNNGRVTTKKPKR